jgi:hypothetical protein
MGDGGQAGDSGPVSTFDDIGWGEPAAADASYVRNL